MPECRRCTAHRRVNGNRDACLVLRFTCWQPRYPVQCTFGPEALRPRLSTGLPLSTRLDNSMWLVARRRTVSHRARRFLAMTTDERQRATSSASSGMTPSPSEPSIRDSGRKYGGMTREVLTTLCRQPRYPAPLRSWTGGFASPPCGGFALVKQGRVDLSEILFAIVVEQRQLK